MAVQQTCYPVNMHKIWLTQFNKVLPVFVATEIHVCHFVLPECHCYNESEMLKLEILKWHVNCMKLNGGLVQSLNTVPLFLRKGIQETSRKYIWLKIFKMPEKKEPFSLFYIVFQLWELFLNIYQTCFQILNVKRG